MNLEIAAWRSLEAWQADAAKVRRAEAADIAALGDGRRLRGTCGLCGTEVEFLCPADMPGSLREGLHCERCRCNARQRAAAMLLLDESGDAGRFRVHATEQVGPLFMALRRRIANLTGSEYAPRIAQRLRLSLWLCRHVALAWVRHEDVTALRMRDASLDAVISLDVLEHVPDYRAALGEFARVIRPGGVLVLTVPFYDDRDASKVIAARREDGSIEHFGEPEYHGDPISGGVPCFHHFAWDLCDAMREAGFADAAACRVRARGGGLPQGQWVFRARR